jgi:hypothetical protein
MPSHLSSVAYSAFRISDESSGVYNMDESGQHEGSHLFLVRLWPDQASGNHDGWHGKVQHVVTGKAGTFSDWPSLVGLLTSLALDLNAPPGYRHELSSWLSAGASPLEKLSGDLDT